MTNPFRDQEKFMKACDQTVEDYNHGQVALYANLIDEEVKELTEKIFQLEQKIRDDEKLFSTKKGEMENNFQKEKDVTIKTHNRKISDLRDKISQLEGDILKLNTELEEEKKKNNKGNDIYGDEKKGGWFGSNLLNRR